jgi:2Fe-2S ferredoxin
MGGENPYIRTTAPRLPAQKYRLTILPANRVIEVDPAKLPYSRDGQKGSILEIALGHGVEIDHACGGVCACSTCHVIVRQGIESMQEASDDELDQLDNARGLSPQSRLACQAVPDGSCAVVVEVPSWNRNLVREDH